MCKFASFVLTQSECFWLSSSDSHEEIIKKNNLQHLDITERLGLVRVEILPPVTNQEDLTTWEFIIDQDKLPDWTFEGDPSLKTRSREALAARAEQEKWFVTLSGTNPVTGYNGTSISGEFGTSTSGDFGTSTSDKCGTSTSGKFGTSTSGYKGTSISGDHGTSTSDSGGTSKSGNYGTSTSGNYGTSKSGYAASSASGDRGTSISGDYSSSTCGDYGVSISGSSGTSISGAYGTSISGIYGVSASGYRGTSKVGCGGKTKAGDEGFIMILDGKWYIANVGENNIKPNVFYKLNSEKQFEETE